MKVEQLTLGEQKTLFIHSPGASAASVQVWFRAGSALENQDDQGIAHFLEHMFFKGTPTRPGAEIARQIEAFGGEVNAFTSFDYTCYYINSPAKKIKEALSILLDMVENPMFLSQDFPAERDVVFEEYRRALDNPQQFHFMRLQEACFRGGYHHPILGREETIKNFSEQQLRAFRNRHYNNENSLIVVAGDLQHRQELDELLTRFRLPHGGQSQFEEFKLSATPAINVHHKEIRQATLSMALQSHSYLDDETAAQDLAINCLAHGETSRLYQSLVAGTSLCNGVAGSTMYFANGGSHLLKMSFPLNNMTKVLATFEKELARLLKDGPQTEEITKIKNQYIASKVYERESIESFAFSLGHGFAQNGNIFCEEDFIARIKDASLGAVARGYAKIFSQPLHLTLQIPQGEDLTKAESALKKFQAKVQALAKKHAKDQQSKLKQTHSEIDPSVSLLQLAPGIRLIHRQNKMTPTFVLHAYLKGGISWEKVTNVGQFHLLSRLFTYGYKGMPYQKLKQDLEERSAALSGFAGKNAYGLTMHGQSTDFDALLGHFAGTLTTPELPKKFFDHERKVILRMLDNAQEDPMKQCFRRYYNLVFKDHPYAFDLPGTPANLKSFTPDKLKKLHKSQLNGQELLLTYCGDQSLETVVEKIQKALKTLKPRKPKAPPRNKIKPQLGQHIHHEMKREQTQIVIGAPACKLTDHEDVYLKMLTAHLSGQGSELFVEVRDRQGLCYAVQPVHVTALDAGCWGIYIGAGADKTQKAIDAITGILHRLSKEGLSLEEFNRIKEMMEGQNQMGIQTNEDYAQFYSVATLHNLGLDFSHHANQAVRDAKYEEFQAYLKKFLSSNWNIVTVGPTL